MRIQDVQATVYGITARGPHASLVFDVLALDMEQAKDLAVIRLKSYPGRRKLSEWTFDPPKPNPRASPIFRAMILATETPEEWDLRNGGA